MLRDKTIHQLWGGCREIDDDYVLYSSMLREHNTDWEYKLWSDEEAYDEVHQLIDEFNIPYKQYTYDIERWDILRFLITYKFGGLICDLDMSCSGSINSIITGCNGFMYEKNISNSPEMRMIHQNFFYNNPGDKFIEHIMKCTRYSLSLAKGLKKREHVSACIGPSMLTRCYSTYPNKPRVNLLNDDDVYEIITHHHLCLW